MKTVVCSHSGRGYSDLSFQEKVSGQFTCGECCTKFYLKDARVQGDNVIVPAHYVPENLHDYRKTLERSEKKRG
jgi:hypothetical protein